MPVAYSRAALANALSRSPRAVRKWQRRADWTFPAKGPWRVEAVRAWMLEHLSQPKPTECGDAEQKARLEWLRARTVTEDLRRETLLRRYHPSDECRRHTRQKLAFLYRGLIAVAPRIVAALRGKPELEWPGLIDAIVRAALRDLAGPRPADDPIGYVGDEE